MPEQLPAALLHSLQMVTGFDEKAFVQAHESGKQVVSIRLNPQKTKEAQHPGLLREKESELIPWTSNGYYLLQRPSFTADPLFHAGAYYVQEASSMFLEEAVRQSCDLQQPIRVLDLCAAPGGKSTLVQSIISRESLLVSNEVIKSRVNVLVENLTKWGAANVVVTNNDPRDFQKLKEYFDVIIVDAPCSGSGLFRKDENAIKEWSVNNVELCSQRQQRILADILPSLKPGGTLIYSTCSYSLKEDEEICDWLLAADQELSSIKLSLKAEWNIVETLSAKHRGYGYRFYPDKLKGEGFFLAAFKKNGSLEQQRPTAKPDSKKLLSNAELKSIEPYFKNIHELGFIKWNDEVLAFPAAVLEDIFLLQSNLYLKKAGVKVGSLIRAELIPDHEFALSNLLSDVVPCLEVDCESALQYLRRNDLKLSTTLKGWTLVKYQHVILGWIKILPGRINNYYPKSWRILNK